MKRELHDTVAMIRTSGARATMKKIISKTVGESVRQQSTDAAFFEKLGMIGALDITPEQWAANQAIVSNPEFRGAEVKTINWFIPRFEHVLYGGIYTIFRFANYFQEQGIQNRFVLYDYVNAPTENLRKMVAESFPALAQAEYISQTPDLDALPFADASICTFWTSAYIMHRFTKTKKKFYFIQDFEPLFYSANSYYALAEATYRMGYTGIVNTPGLASVIERDYQMSVRSFTPCVNTAVYSISEAAIAAKLAKDVTQIVVYARPNHDRNAFELAIATLRKVKERYGERVRIVAAGDDWDPAHYGVADVLENIGRLNSLEAVADLYRASDIGLVFMFTKHPSYQPFEFMACGTVVATNVNSANTWLLKDEENAVVMEPIPGLMVEKIASVIDDRDKREALLRAGLKTLENQDWDMQCQSIFEYIQAT